MNDINNNDRLLTIVEAYANELTEKAELVRALGKQLISFAPQIETDYLVDWNVRTGRDHSLIEIELALRGRQLSVTVCSHRANVQGPDIPF